MTLQATLTINNSTTYNIDVVHNNTNTLLGTLAPSQAAWSWNTSEDVNHGISLRFYQQANNYSLIGYVGFGSATGVYLDRGYIPGAQTVELNAHVTGSVPAAASLSENGGEQLLTTGQFTNGGTIELTINAL